MWQRLQRSSFILGKGSQKISDFFFQGKVFKGYPMSIISLPSVAAPFAFNLSNIFFHLFQYILGMIPVPSLESEGSDLVRPLCADRGDISGPGVSGNQ